MRGRKKTMFICQSVRQALVGAVFVFCLPVCAWAEPTRLIYDTDMGNDIDDALALAVIHALQSRGECELLAVTVTKDSELAAPFVDALNTFYGRGDIPIGMVRQGKTPEDGKFLPLAKERDQGDLRYPHDLATAKDAPAAVSLLREILAVQPDHSVAMVQVGFSTNFARLLESPADKHSPLNGRELVAKKSSLLSLMAGAFQTIDGNNHFCEYNVVQDIENATKLVAGWPTPVVFSGFEIGYSIRTPMESIENDFQYCEHHLIPEAYRLYCQPDENRPTWDLTSVLYAIRPDRNYFSLSAPGRVTVESDGFTRFSIDASGQHQFLIATPSQQVRVQEALVQLSSQPPQWRAED